MCEQREPRISVSVEMKVNLGNYESACGSCVLSGIPEDATGADIDRLLETAEMTFGLIKERIEQRLYDIRTERAAPGAGRNGAGQRSG